MQNLKKTRVLDDTPQNRRIPDKILRNAERHLASVDPIMRQLMTKYGPCALLSTLKPVFHVLATMIISQQLSAKAALTIKSRLTRVVSDPLNPKIFLKLPVKTLRTAGLSARKITYIYELARQINLGKVSLTDMKRKNDTAIIETLMKLPGIGVWTAEMFLIFALKRLDILAVNDVGLQRAVKLLYGPEHPSGDLLLRKAVAWIPYRSVASWYLWRHLD